MKFKPDDAILLPCLRRFDRLEDRLDKVLSLAVVNRDCAERIESYLNGTIRFEHLGTKEKTAILIALITSGCSTITAILVALL